MTAPASKLKPRQVTIGSNASFHRGLVWACGDFSNHYHRWQWTAWICIKIQAAWNRWAELKAKGGSDGH